VIDRIGLAGVGLWHSSPFAGLGTDNSISVGNNIRNTTILS